MGYSVTLNKEDGTEPHCIIICTWTHHHQKCSYNHMLCRLHTLLSDHWAFHSCIYFNYTRGYSCSLTHRTVQFIVPSLPPYWYHCVCQWYDEAVELTFPMPSVWHMPRGFGPWPYDYWLSTLTNSTRVAT